MFAAKQEMPEKTTGNEEAKPQSDKQMSNREFFKTIAYAVVLAAIIRSFFFEPFHIPSGSMKDSLLIGDYLFVSKYSYGYSRYSFPFGLPLFKGRVGNDERPKRGEVVVFRLPSNPRVDYIKRIIGLPGDKIQVTDGVLYINGDPVKLKEDGVFVDDDNPERPTTLKKYVETLPNGVQHVVLDETPYGNLDNTRVYVVPAGHYFAMGDNRDNSLDSRAMEKVGYVPEENLVGRAELILFSARPEYHFWQFWHWDEYLRGGRFFRKVR